MIANKTPFSLKETYGKDKLRLSPLAGKGNELSHILESQNLSFKAKDDYIVTEVSESMSALPILDSTRHLLSGFEVVQGSMDDVFLNVTGKTLGA